MIFIRSYYKLIAFRAKIVNLGFGTKLILD